MESQEKEGDAFQDGGGHHKGFKALQARQTACREQLGQQPSHVVMQIRWQIRKSLRPGG